MRVFGVQHQLAGLGQLQRWQDLRNVTAAALQLGAGLGPGDVRALTLRDVDPGRSVSALTVAGTSHWPDRTPQAATAVIARRTNRPTQLWVRVPANGNAPTHEAPLADWAARLLAAWLAQRERLAIPGEWLLPSTRTGKPWGKVAQYQAACEVLADAGVATQAAGGSFRLRHTFAMRQLLRGHAPETVAGWLGVTDPSVMQRYLRQMEPVQPAEPEPW
jgi:integrase